jgi:hypothetical protein
MSTQPTWLKTIVLDQRSRGQEGTMKQSSYIALGVALLGLVGVLILVGWVYYRSSDLTFVYDLHVEYGKMPGDDSELATWLKSQPGVSAVSITREGKALEVIYEAKGGQPIPDVIEKADTLGYEGRGSFFGNMNVK